MAAPEAEIDPTCQGEGFGFLELTDCIRLMFGCASVALEPNA